MRFHQRRQSYRALKLALLGAAASLGACSPLAQAPLVYSSKQTLGLDVSTTSTETPGLSISLGFKNVDAAYVPVAVAQACNPGDKSAVCDRTKLTLTPLTARTTASNSRTPLAQIAQKADRDLQEAKQDLAVKQADLDAKTRTQAADVAKAKDLDAATKALAALKAVSVPSTPGSDPAIAAQANATAGATLQSVQDRVAIAQTAAANATTNLEAVNAAKVAVANAQTRVENTAAALDKANAEQAKSENEVREDAMSVYGSFDGGTNFSGTGENGAGLSVGKMFSTGVTSQQLTARIGIAGCVQAATAAATEINKSTLAADVKNRLIQKNYEYCSAATREHVEAP